MGIAPLAFHIAPTLTEEDTADRAVSQVAVLNIPPDRAVSQVAKLNIPPDRAD